MRLLRRFPVLAFALVLIGLAGFCTAQQSVGLLLVAGTLAAMSWYVTEGPRGRSLPRWVSNLLVLAALLNVPVDLWQHRDDVLGALGRFTVWLALIKLYERKEPRNHARLLALSLLMMTIGSIKSANLLFAVLLLLYTVVGLYVLMLYQLYGAHEEMKTERLGAVPVGARPVGTLRPPIGSHARLQFGSLVGSVAVVGLLLSLLWFVIFPRNLTDAVVTRLQARSTERRTGFTDEINLTAGTRITDSPRAVMTVKLLDGAGEPLAIDQPVYLRGSVLTDYRGGGVWKPGHAQARRITTEPPLFSPLGSPQAEPQPGIIQQVEMIASSDTLFSIYVPTSLAAPGRYTIDFKPLSQTLKTAPGHRPPDRYTIKANRAPTDETLRQLMRGRQPPLFGGARFDDPRVAELARELLTKGGLDTTAPASMDERWSWHRRAAGILNAHLRSGVYLYVTDLGDVVLGRGHEGATDPIVQFLFETKRGHCEFFASALAAMCHVVGVPARVVAGYVTLEHDALTGRYIVRESNAHAWVEVRTGPYRWTMLDPTPPGTLRTIHAGRHGFVDRLMLFYDKFDFTWNRGVIGFDSGAQRRLYDSLDLGWSHRLGASVEAVRERMSRINRAFYFGPAGYIWMGLVALALVVAVITLIKLMRRSISVRRTLRIQHLHGAEYQQMLRHLGFYLDMLQVLHRAKHPKPAWQPPLQYARALASSHPEAAALVRRITSTFYEARYGRQLLTVARVNRAKKRVEQLSSSLKSRDF